MSKKGTIFEYSWFVNDDDKRDVFNIIVSSEWKAKVNKHPETIKELREAFNLLKDIIENTAQEMNVSVDIYKYKKPINMRDVKWEWLNNYDE